LIFIEIGEQFFKQFVDIFINPMSILELDNHIVSINIRQVFLTDWMVFEVINQHENHSGDFFPIEEVTNLGYFLD